MPYKNSEDKKKYQREYQKNRPKRTRKRDRTIEYKWRATLKREILSFYGKECLLRCCWSDCNISDPDMLTLDHINNDGAKHRKETNMKGARLYKYLKDNEFPSGYQTLCMNHQFKKQLVLGRQKSLRNTL
jgi:hypothetical protein